ncbi:MmgE/PrpD family protein [Paraburkholderia fungorum]|uniref:MmgE/PrpD family protein n=1 Tax=Paraburkholderia fungorum TaxID=134537 RepID=A0A420FKE1_9BURK|nr:MmgE/PrpD family protein [Paraburkholderia fungorum]RKF33363.1 hypothetical protein BCY88_09880 [Paraburkholderia fungorum]
MMSAPNPTFDSKRPTQALATLAASVPGESIPDETLTCIEECVLDFIGNAAYAGRFAESSASFRDGARQTDPAGTGFTVIGERESYSRGQAAMLNGAFAHTLDFDDTNSFGVLHPGAPIIPAALCCAEQSDVTGRQLAEAIAVGYEVTCRIGAALGTTAYDRGFHNTPVAGIFGAVAAGGRLQHLNNQQMAAAFGIAASLAAGSLQCLEDGAWNKRLHPGFAAHNALIALDYARVGVLSAEEPLAGRYGLLTGYTNSPKPGLLTEDLYGLWVAGHTAIKPYPSCRFNHSATDAALALRERCTAKQRTEAALQIEISQKAFDLVGEPQPAKVAPRNVVDGQFSIYFQVAVAWLFGAVTPQSYERLGAPDVEALTRRMVVRVNSRFSLGECRMSVEGIPDATIDVPVPSGEPRFNPLPRHRIKSKFMSLATPVFGEQAANTLADTVLDLRQSASTTALIAGMRPAAQQA